MTARSTARGEGEPGDPQRGLRLLLERRFGAFAAALLVSNSGSWIQLVSAVTLVWALTGSGVAVGAVAAANHFPQLVLSPLAGVLGDRVDKRRLIVLTQGAAGVASGALAAYAWLASEVQPAMVVALVALVATMRTLALPVMNAVVPHLVPPADVPQAFAFQSMTHTIGRAVGPLVGGVLYALGGAGLAFAVNAVSFAAPVGVFLVISGIGGPGRTQGKPRVGLRQFLRGPGGVLLALGGVAATAVGSDPVITLAPLMVAELGQSADLVGGLMSAYGVGAVVTGLFVGRVSAALTPGRAGAAGLVAVCAGLGVFALSPVAWLSLAAIFVCGCGHVLAVSGLTSMLLLTLPSGVHGRIMGLWGSSLIGTRSVAALVHGSLADIVGVRATVLVPVAVTGVVGILLWVRSPREGAGGPAPPAGPAG